MVESAAILALLGTYSVVMLIWYVIIVIANWKIFTKAGEAGWKSIIPVYNIYILYKICWKTNMFWIMLACSILGTVFSALGGFWSVLGSIVMIASAVISIMQNIKLSKAFGHGGGYAVGLILLQPIFILILGFGKSTYVGAQQ